MVLGGEPWSRSFHLSTPKIWLHRRAPRCSAQHPAEHLVPQACAFVSRFSNATASAVARVVHRHPLHPVLCLRLTIFNRGPRVVRPYSRIYKRYAFPAIRERRTILKCSKPRNGATNRQNAALRRSACFYVAILSEIPVFVFNRRASRVSERGGSGGFATGGGDASPINCAKRD